MRGPLLPGQAPLARTRAERFDDLVLDAVELLDKQWARELAAVDFAVEEVPPVGSADVTHDAAADVQVPMSRLVLPAKGSRARVIIYRRPLETRAGGRDELGSLVYRVVVEELANLLGLEPERIDPSLDDGG